jgi:transcriptional repressor NrdR
MRCPFCGHADTQVKDSRPSEDGATIRRRRHCPECESRFTTFERIQLRELTVVKRNGERRIFDRDKIERSMSVALRKRPVDPDLVEQEINAIVKALETSGDTEVEVTQIGERVMEALKRLDPVAYIRYASVYRDFREAKDFEQFVEQINSATQR